MEKDKIWTVSVRLVDNDVFYHTGMEISEVLVADDKDSALDKLLQIHSVDRKNISVNFIQPWNE